MSQLDGLIGLAKSGAYVALQRKIERLQDKCILMCHHAKELDATALEDSIGVARACAEIDVAERFCESALTWLEVVSRP